jgi:hypothetical protein
LRKPPRGGGFEQKKMQSANFYFEIAARDFFAARNRFIYQWLRR